MLVALRMLIARSVSDLGKESISVISNALIGGSDNIELGSFGAVLLAQVDIA